jgi:crotonobetainyl-CoA:carnitine CoA-transferase CaiB-like acyl-CoA transferase
VPNVSPPLQLSRTPIITPVAAPLLGQHTYDVLSKVLGLSPEKITELNAEKVIRVYQPDPK